MDEERPHLRFFAGRAEQAQASEGFAGITIFEAGLLQSGDQAGRRETAVEAAERSPQADRDDVPRIAADAQRLDDRDVALVGLHEDEPTAWLQDSSDFSQHLASVDNQIEKAVAGTGLDT